jgi:hypothetical protein
MLNYVVRGGCSYIEPLCLYCQSFFLQLPCLCGRLKADFGTLDGNQSITDLQPNLAGQLLEADLTLAELKQITRGVRLGDAIPQWDVELDPYQIIWVIATENLSDQVAVAAQQDRVWRRHPAPDCSTAPPNHYFGRLQPS